jgi:hypothetical protein
VLARGVFVGTQIRIARRYYPSTDNSLPGRSRMKWMVSLEPDIAVQKLGSKSPLIELSACALLKSSRASS